MLKSNSCHIKVAVVTVLLVLGATLLSKYFAKNYNVQYTRWFINTMNRLVDTAETSANWGNQDSDPLMALQDYTTALTIMDTLCKIVKHHELQSSCNINVDAFIKLVDGRRQAVVKLLQNSCHT